MATGLDLERVKTAQQALASAMVQELDRHHRRRHRRRRCLVQV
jgi:hypothetical protein